MTLTSPAEASPIVAALTPFPATIGRFPNTVPFTYRDGSTFAEMFEQWTDWIEEDVVPEIVKDVNLLVDAYNTASASLAAAMLAYKDEIAADRQAFETLVDGKLTDMNAAIAANAQAMANAIQQALAYQSGAQAAQTGAEAARDAAQGWAAGTQALQDTAVKTLVSTANSLTQQALKTLVTPTFIGLGNVANLSPSGLVQSQPFADAFGALPKTVDGISQNADHDITLNPYDAFYGIRYLAFGHSFGVVQNIQNAYKSSTYPERIAKILQVDPALYSNNTVSGQRMNGMLATVRAGWNRGDYGMATIMCAANDLGNGTPVTSWKADLTSAMQWIRGMGPFQPTIVLVKEVYWTQKGYNRYSTPPNDGTIDLWNTYYDQVAATFPSDGSVVVVDPRPGWDAATMTAFDGQHPNERGQAHISRAIVKALRNRPYREGQNYGIATAIPFFYDSFNRDNMDDGPKYNMFGEGYTQVGGTDPAGIISNRLRRVGAVDAANTVYIRDMGYANMRVGIDHSDPGTRGAGIVFRYTDINNHWVIDVNGTGVNNGSVYKKTAGGAYTLVGSRFSKEVASNSRVELTIIGNVMTVFVDGVQVWTATDTFNSGATKIGFRFAYNDSRLDNFKCEPL